MLKKDVVTQNYVNLVIPHVSFGGDWKLCYFNNSTSKFWGRFFFVQGLQIQLAGPNIGTTSVIHMDQKVDTGNPDQPYRTQPPRYKAYKAWKTLLIPLDIKRKEKSVLSTFQTYYNRAK